MSDVEPFDVVDDASCDDDADDDGVPRAPRRVAWSASMRSAMRRVRAARARARCVRLALSAVCAVLWTVVLVVGVAVLVHADSVVDSAYAPTLCTVVDEHSIESSCAYYNVTLRVHEPGTPAAAARTAAACALLANVARNAQPRAPRACNAAVEAERARYANASLVECYAPRSPAALVDAERCAEAATASGAWAELEHARADDFVYLGSVVEGRAALRAATQVQRELGGWLVAGGAFALLVTVAMTCGSSVAEYCADAAERAESLAAGRRERARPLKQAVE